MDKTEYQNLNQVENNHWYYSGKRDLVTYWIKRCSDLNKKDILLDFGAGTGRFALDFLSKCQVRVFDSYPESLSILRERFPAESILESKGDRILTPDSSVNFVTALDVLEHLADDATAVEEFHRVLNPSGLAIITVPADMKLWSDWDVSLFHHRRYNRRQLLALFDNSKWDIVHCTYTNIFAYPAVYILRKLRKITKATPTQNSRAEDHIPPPWVNKILRFLFVAPAKTSWFPAPFGVSLILVARKR